MMASFRERIKSGEVLIADGATGTNLLSRGLPRGKPAEAWVLEKPEEIIRLHQDFIDAGCDIVLTCTFGATPLRLEGSELAGHTFEINQQAVRLARQAIQGRPVYVGGSIGPSGQLMKPYGPLDETEVMDSYIEQINALADAGVDLLVIETQFSLEEARTAVRAAHAVCNLPIVCSFSFDRGIRTMMGVRPSQLAQEIEPLEVDLLGINCGRSLEENLQALKELRRETQLPLWFKPNAGLPEVDENGQVNYSITPEEMGHNVHQWLMVGAQVVGGCCGTTPDHLKRIASHVRANR